MGRRGGETSIRTVMLFEGEDKEKGVGRELGGKKIKRIMRRARSWKERRWREVNWE